MEEELQAESMADDGSEWGGRGAGRACLGDGVPLVCYLCICVRALLLMLRPALPPVPCRPCGQGPAAAGAPVRRATGGGGFPALPPGTAPRRMLRLLRLGYSTAWRLAPSTELPFSPRQAGCFLPVRHVATAHLNFLCPADCNAYRASRPGPSLPSLLVAAVGPRLPVCGGAGRAAHRGHFLQAAAGRGGSKDEGDTGSVSTGCYGRVRYHWQQAQRRAQPEAWHRL